jgi:glycosyltransferase involved in cell wall biosynthesis
MFGGYYPMTINVFAHYSLNPYDSFGLIAVQLMRHLSEFGCTVNARVRPNMTIKNLPPDIEKIVAHPPFPATGGIFMGWPTTYAEHGREIFEHPRIAITMFESSKLPPGWTDVLNDFDALIVPGQFCADLFRDNGITAPIHIVPLGINEIYRPVERSLAPALSDMEYRSRPITFITCGDRGWRKGGLTAMNCFLRAFGDDPNYHLIMKMRPGGGVAVECTNPNITWIREDMTEEELYKLYLRCDAMISTNRCEGFGLLPREFAATGGIALATDWGGTADDIEGWGWPLPYSLVNAQWEWPLDNHTGDMGQWAEPDQVGVAECLRDVAENIDGYRVESMAKAANAIEMYSWRRFSERVFEIWQQVSMGVPA